MSVRLSFGRRAYAACCLLWAAALAFLTGCQTFKVDKIDGLTQLIRQQARAEILALKLKQRFPDTKSTNYLTAEKLYDAAAGDVNGFLKSISSEAHLKQQVSVPSDRFDKDAAASSLKTFLDEGNKLAGSGIVGFDPISTAAIVDLAKNVGSAIIDWNHKLNDDALKRLDDELGRARTVNYGSLTVDYVDKKYAYK